MNINNFCKIQLFVNLKLSKAWNVLGSKLTINSVDFLWLHAYQNIIIILDSHDQTMINLGTEVSEWSKYNEEKQFHHN